MHGGLVKHAQRTSVMAQNSRKAERTGEKETSPTDLFQAL